MRLTVIVAGMLAAALAVASPALADGPPPPDPHAATLASVRQAQARLADLRAAIPGGLNQTYFNRLLDYYQAVKTVRARIVAEADDLPQVAPLHAADQAAADVVRRRLAAPDTDPVDLAQAQDQSAEASAAYAAALAAASAGLAPEAQALPDPLGRDLWAKGQDIDFSQSLQLLVSDEPINPGAWGGKVTEFKTAPWQVEIQWADADRHVPPFPATELHACGGALIRADWVLTAAHCVWDRHTGLIPTASLRVRAGASELSAPMQTFAIDDIRLPAGPRAYVLSTAVAPARNDIALVHITPPTLAGTLLRPIRTATAVQAVTPSFELTVTGWGATVRQSAADQAQRALHEGRLRMSPELRIVPLQYLPTPDCNTRIRARIASVDPRLTAPDLPAGAFCAGSRFGGTCTGDSGGPLVLHTGHRERRFRHLYGGGRRDSPVLVGVVSWGVGCDDFTVFTEVASYADWIAATLDVPRRAPPTPADSGRRAPPAP